MIFPGLTKYYWIVGNGVSNWLEKITDYVSEERELREDFKRLKLSAHVSENDYRWSDIIEIYDQEHFEKCVSNFDGVSVGDTLFFVLNPDINTENHYDEL